MATPSLPEIVRPQDAVLLYDGLCGFCDGTVRWLLRHTHANDRKGRIYFAPQQSELAQVLFVRHGLCAAGHTVYLLIHPGKNTERVLERSDAILYALAMLGGAWKLLALLLYVLPHGLRDAAYAAIARNRYRIAGRRTECGLPSAEEKRRFLGL
ncbi:MAG TPA: DCC1-like thiol-disulfide oxidoreductase family protein [Acidobacteriaceae bacterium]|jgi:predicted DCC family thiol-disulfide oxidoreductase YuxK|nr:DCC1-like thiol-disulfide oxidoreductase family protein [Acidobacteriaceae bacterium]